MSFVAVADVLGIRRHANIVAKSPQRVLDAAKIVQFVIDDCDHDSTDFEDASRFPKIAELFSCNGSTVSFCYNTPFVEGISRVRPASPCATPAPSL